MGLTRARVNQLLSQAPQAGLVSISINERDIGLIAQEEAILTAFNLDFYITTPALGADGAGNDALRAIAFNMVGAAAAQFLREQLLLKPDAIIGTGWGRTLDRVSRNMFGMSVPRAKFVSLMGSLASNSSFNPFEVVHALTQMTGAEGYFLPAPFIADSSAEDLKSLREAGAVADTNGIFFDARGSALTHDLNSRVIAVDLIPQTAMQTVLLSAGPGKVSATRAVLQSGAMTGLIIDGDSACALCATLD